MWQQLYLVFNTRLLTAFFMGAASGLPYLLTITLMQAWAQDAGISVQIIGLMTLVGLPYTLKFLWAPLFDRFTLPFLGRRRGWLLVIQIALMLSIVAMGQSQPEQGDWGLRVFVLMAVLVAFFSASQDIVIDAYRREDLRDAELGLGSSYYVYGYRIGMLAVSGGGMILADYLSWDLVFLIFAACLIPSIVMTLSCSEPKVTEVAPRNFRESVVEPLSEFFRRDMALTVIAFILFYKVGDNLASALTTKFYLDLGFSKSDIGVVAKLFGFWATLLGGFLGGLYLLKRGIKRALWLFGGLQMVSTAGFALLAFGTPQISFLAGVVSFENLASGMGTAAFVAYMASLTNKRFTATQYALLTSLMRVPQVVLGSSTGYLVEFMGWGVFFVFCTLMALPGMALLRKIHLLDQGSLESNSKAQVLVTRHL